MVAAPCRTRGHEENDKALPADAADGNAIPDSWEFGGIRRHCDADQFAFENRVQVSVVARQAPLAPDQAIEEIIATAQRREENLQDVPVSIKALTSEDIATFRCRDPGDLAAQVPNLQTSNTTGDGT